MFRKLRDFYFTVDLRSLGLFRIFLGSLLVADWWLRLPDLDAFYTASGLFPMDASLPRPGGIFHFCLLDGVTSLPMVRTVFCLGLVCYILFLVGYRTSVFQGLSVVFFLSVLSRAPMIRDGSVMVIATMLIWSVFLPLGKRFSLDVLVSRANADESNGGSDITGSDFRCAPSLAAFAIIAQIGMIYLFTAVAKHGATWKEGTALYYALNLDQLTRPFGRWLASQPMPLLKTLTWGVLSLEFAALPLILAPFGQPWLRRMAILLLALMHGGIALATTLSFFSITMVSTFALLLLPEDWAFFTRSPVLHRLPETGHQSLKHIGALLRPWVKALGPAPKTWGEREDPMELNHTKQLKKRLVQIRGWAVGVIVVLIFLSFTVDAYNLNATRGLSRDRIKEPTWMRAIILVPLIQQDWELFAPDPTREDGWWVIDGETESGEAFDPLTGKVPTFDKPSDLAFRFDRFWRKYLDRIWLKKNSEYRLFFAKYITRKNHREKPKGERLARFHFYYVKEVTQPPGTPEPWPTERLLIWHHDCFASATPAKSDAPPPDTQAP